MNDSSDPMKGAVAPFLQVSLGWLLISSALVWKFAPDATARSASLRWLFVLWVLCEMDLLAIGKLLSTVFQLTTESVKNRSGLVIRASSWGAIKLACLGIIGLILFRGQAIPSLGLLPGLGTMIVVPLFGGLWWHLRFRRHA